MSNKIAPSNSGALVVHTSQGIVPGNANSKKEITSTGLVSFIHRKVLGILGKNLAARLGFQSKTSAPPVSSEPEQNTPSSCRVNLIKLQQTKGFISTSETAYGLLFGDMKHVVALPYSDFDKKDVVPEVGKRAMAHFAASQRSNASYRLPPAFTANYSAILEDAWMNCNTTEGIAPNTQYAISSAMDLQMNVLESIASVTLDEYKEKIQVSILGVSQLLKDKIQLQPSTLRDAYGLDGEVPPSLVYFFLDAITAEQLVTYTVRDFISGVSSAFGKTCLETVLESIGTEYLYKYPHLDRRNELRMGPYMIQPNKHLSDIKFANEVLLDYGIIANNADMDEYKRSLFRYAIHSPHDTFVILLVDRFLQYLSFVEKSIPQYQKGDPNGSLSSLFARIAKNQNQGYLSTVRGFFENVGSEGVRQLIRILMVPAPIDARFSSDILAWMQRIETEGLIDFNDFMELRLQAEKDTTNQVHYTKTNPVFHQFSK